MKIHTFVFTVSTHLSWVLNTICILCFFGRLCNTAERRSCSIFFYFLLFSRYFFHFHIRFMKVEFHTFFRISLCRSRVPAKHFSSYGKFHFLDTKIPYTKGHTKKLLPFSMCPIFSFLTTESLQNMHSIVSDFGSCFPYKEATACR